MNKNIKNSLIGVRLNKDRLYDDVIKQIAESDLPYISESSKKNLLSFKDNDISNLKKLWKNLLIDSICILKINDSREKIYRDAKKYENKFKSNFDEIRMTSSYGIDEISNYFDDFIVFESVLYGTDEHYRDHVDHVLQVWAIGVSLLSQNKFTLSEGYEINMESYFHYNITEDTEDTKDTKDTKNTEDTKDTKNNQISQSEIFAMWTIISLCHDLGYPIEKTAKINTQAKKIIGHFGNMNFNELSYSFDIFNTFLVDKFLNIISSKASTIINNTSKDDKGNKVDKCGITKIQTKYRDKFSKSLEEYKHGIFSSLLLFKNLTYFLETDYYSSEDSLSEEDLRQFYIRKEILRAIAAHTCPKIYHLSLNSLSFLLILCDELQEWNRPKFDELLNRKYGNEPYIEIKNFSIDNDQKIKIQFKYDKIEKEHLKYFIDNKFKNIHCLLRSAKDDKDRNVNFIWEIIANNITYTLNFDSKNDSFDIMKFTETSDGKETAYKLY